MSEISYHREIATTSGTSFASKLGYEAGQNKEDNMEGKIVNLSDHEPKAYQPVADAEANKERRRGRHGESDGTQSLVMKRSVSGSGLCKISGRRQLFLWPRDSNTIRRSRTFDGELVGGQDPKTTMALKASSCHGPSMYGIESEAAASLRKIMSNPKLMEAEKRCIKPNNLNGSKNKEKVAEPNCDSSKATIPGKCITNDTNPGKSLIAALSRVSFKGVDTSTSLLTSSLKDHASLILRQHKIDRLASINSNDPSNGGQSIVRPRIASRRGLRRSSTMDESRMAGRLFPTSTVATTLGSMKAGKESFPSFLLDDVVDTVNRSLTMDKSSVSGRVLPMSTVANTLGNMKAGKESFPSFLLDDVGTLNR
jgi:hypothetical protein